MYGAVIYVQVVNGTDTPQISAPALISTLSLIYSRHLSTTAIIEWRFYSEFIG
jgi:hypothetical protein